MIKYLYNNEFEIADELHKKGERLLFYKQIFKIVIRENNFELFKWLIAHNYKLDRYLIADLIHSEMLEKSIQLIDLIDLIDLLCQLTPYELKKINTYRDLKPFSRIIKELGAYKNEIEFA